MPVIKFSEADRLAALPVEDGWYQMVIEKVGDAAASKSGKSLNFFTDFRITGDGPATGKVLTVCFNTETSQPSVLGSMQFFPHSKLLEVQAAIYNKNIREVSLNVDTDDLLEKPFDCQIVRTIENGVPMNVIRGFLPLGKGKEANVVPF